MRTPVLYSPSRVGLTCSIWQNGREQRSSLRRERIRVGLTQAELALARGAGAGAHDWYLGTVAVVGAEQANTVPPGVAQPISALIAYILHCEDFMFNTAIQDVPPLWERVGWGAKLGGSMLLDQEESAARAYTRDPRQMADYATAVFANTDAVLSSLTDGDLDRELDLVQFGFPANMTIGAFLTQMLLGNTYARTGEISSLKGSMSMRGYAF
ncbi:MAG: DinB family protein [Chloroflexi bacterium]|nr:DinB family protein [Chloroflexota bacterium]